MKNYITLSLLLITSCFGFSQTVVSTYAGDGTQGFIDGDTAAARFRSPFGICMDKNSNLYIADGGNHSIRKITASGIVTTLAGTGVAGYLDGAAASAQFNNPTGVCADDSGNVYVSDFQNHRIRKISYSGSVTTVAGNGTPGYTDGSPATAQFSYPRGICGSKNGNLFVGDSWNHRIRKIDANGNVSTYAGGGVAFGVSSVGGLVDAKDTAARFYTPAGVSIDKNNNVFVADAYNHRIRRIDTARNVSTVAGSGATGVGNGGYANGPVTMALLNTPTELHVDSTGLKIYIGDTFNNRVRAVEGGTLYNLAGKGTAGYVNGVDTAAQFNYVRGVVCNSVGNVVYVIDYNNHSVRKISWISTVGVPEIKNNDLTFSLYPNPNHGSFKIDLNSEKKADVEIYGVDGKCVYSKKEINSAETIQLKQLEAGIYFLKVYSENNFVVKKFVIL
ncbi:MAG: Serine/threonine-protein kinase PknD [Bacteroidetes bacterium]|nr:Serine/threonine-protein kinase PknD [Bacteroidota bacterium]